MKKFIAIIFLFTCHFSNSQPVGMAGSAVSVKIKAANDTMKLKGDSTQFYTGSTNKRAFSAKPETQCCKATSLIAPAALITYGIVALNNNAVRNLDITTSRTIKAGNSNFKNNADNYLQYAPALAVYGLNAIGIKGKNNLVDRSVMFGLSTILTAAIVSTIKPLSNIQRPDGSAANSFPSGHTTTAFAAAEFLHQEYKHRSPLYSILGYAAATTTGILRMYNNKHYLSDVVAGAGFGMLSTKIVYWIYPVIKRKIAGRKSASANRSAVIS